MKVLFVTLFIFTSMFLFGLNSQGNYDAEDLLARMNGYASETPSLLLSFTGIGLDWSSVSLSKRDQDIHLGVSANFGMTVIPATSWSKVTRPFSTELYSVILPTRTYVARVGWPGSSIDFGAWYKEMTSNLMSSVTFNANSYGLLSRMQLLRTEANGFDLSVATNAGVSSVKMATTSLNDLTVDDLAASRQMYMKLPELTTDQMIYSLDVSILSGKQFWGFLTTYGGFSLAGGIGDTKLAVKTRSVTDSASSIAYWTKYFPSISVNGFSSHWSKPALSLSVLLGSGIQISLVHLDVGSRIDILSGGTSFEAIARFQM